MHIHWRWGEPHSHLSDGGHVQHALIPCDWLTSVIGKGAREVLLSRTANLYHAYAAQSFE